jgi:hypothetical protein
VTSLFVDYSSVPTCQVSIPWWGVCTCAFQATMELGGVWATLLWRLWGMDPRVDTLIPRNCLGQTWKLKPSLVFFFLSCVCFAMSCGFSYESYWYSVGCGWMQGESRFLGSRSPLGNSLPPWFVLLGDLVLLVIVCRPTLRYWPWMWISSLCQSQSCQR